MRAITFYSTLALGIVALVLLLTTQAVPRYSTSGIGNFAHDQNQYPKPNHNPLLVPTDEANDDDHRTARPENDPTWTFTPRRDANNYGLSESQCLSAFPELYAEIDRAIAYRRKTGNITLSDVEVGWRGDGIVRAMIVSGQLYIIDAHAVSDRNHRPRSIATLHALNRALVAVQGRENVPDVEFTLTDHDSALMDPKGKHVTLAYSRLKEQESLWLMPDFGFWGWPSVGMNSYSELRALLEEAEDDFLDKVPKAVWRGGLGVAGADMRRKMLKLADGQNWADVRALDWKNETDIKEGLISMEDHCGYMFALMTEGNTYSGRLKFLLNCHSVVVSHELKWIEHFHHLLRSSGPEQNYVKVRRDFSDLPRTIKEMLHAPTLQDKGQSIATNARKVFGDRYLTPAAEACYWRALVRGWASVQGFKPQRWEEVEEADWHVGSGGRKTRKKPRGVPFEAYVVMEANEWSIPAKPRRLCIDDG